MGMGYRSGLWWLFVCVVEGAKLHGFVWILYGGDYGLSWILCDDGDSVGLSGFIDRSRLLKWGVVVGCGLPTWYGWWSRNKKKKKDELFYNILIGYIVK